MTHMAPASVRETLQKWILANGMSVVWDLHKSKGAYLHDAISDIGYLDFFGFFASRALAFNHPRLNEPEFIERIGRAALAKPSNCDIYTPEYAEFVDKFATVALGGEFRHVFFIEGGSPAVENALKAAMDWKHRKNIAAGRGEKGTQIIHFKQGFHGRTGYALSLTDSPDPRKTQFFPKFDWPRVTNPAMSFPFDDAAKAKVEALEAQALAEINAAIDNNPDDIAAIIIEPIQSEGGDNYFRSEFLAALRTIADEREVMLIFDEIQTGFGGTGKWWDWQHHGVKPDLMVFGKKTQVCGFASTERVDEIDGVFKVGSRISSTFEGNLVDMVRCSRIIDVIVEEELLSNAATMGTYMLKVFRDLAANHPQMSAVRGRGLFCAFDMPTTQERDALIAACFKEELLVLPCGRTSVRVRPALDIRADAIGRAAAQLEAGLRRAYRK